MYGFKLFLLFFLLCYVSLCFGQIKRPQIVIPITFEDATGAKDTVFYGFDSSAQFGTDDPQFGESPLPPENDKFSTRITRCKESFLDRELNFECLAILTPDSFYRIGVQNIPINFYTRDSIDKPYIVVNRPKLPLTIKVGINEIQRLFDVIQRGPRFFLDMMGFKNTGDTIVNKSEQLFSYLIRPQPGTTVTISQEITDKPVDKIYLGIYIYDFSSVENQLNRLKISVFPAVFSSSVKIRSSENTSDVLLEVRNLWGQTVYRELIQPREAGEKFFDFSFLPSGCYTFNFHSDGKFVSVKTFKSE